MLHRQKREERYNRFKGPLRAIQLHFGFQRICEMSENCNHSALDSGGIVGQASCLPVKGASRPVPGNDGQDARLTGRRDACPTLTAGFRSMAGTLVAGWRSLQFRCFGGSELGGAKSA
jgi:hypothetical protein